MTSKTHNSLRILMLAAVIAAFAAVTAAQPTGTAPNSTTSSKAATESVTTRSETETSDSFDSRSTRDHFSALLDRHPHEVGVMLKLDPTLFRNEAWIAAYPALRDFIAAHPEVPQNPSYYLERVYVPGDDAPEPAALRMTRNMIEGVQVFVVMLTFLGAAIWLIKTLLEHRRWSRVSRVQTEIYNKLLDRFTSHEDLMRYVQSEAGKNFIQSAISPISTGTAAQLSAPIGRILWSAQAGIVLVMIGVGLQFVSGRLHPDAAGAVSTFGILALCAGLGFTLSAFVAWVVSRRLGILPSTPEPNETEMTSTRTLGER
ncbi:MAG: hypothetical protein HYU52_09115 [Acidobacteria bacterium]|nr:hypothetical protein [Acidobacteriota bacterium]